MSGGSGDFDDAPQWYWAAADSMSEGRPDQASDRFVVASGQRELWARVRLEVDPAAQCSWQSFGPKDGQATLADCMTIFIMAREMYGAAYNRLTLELAQIEAFARFIKEGPLDLCNWVSNPTSHTPLPRVGYDSRAEQRLGRRIAGTLGLEDDWWR
jgi:hypothetical protein